MENSSNTTAVPDLQAILATLAQHMQPTAPIAPNPRDEYGSPTPEIDQEAIKAGTAPPRDLGLHDPRLRPQNKSAAASPRPMIDPASITVWSEALRCVTKIAAQNSQFAVSIKRMIKDQRAHEMRWYTERQNLKQTQANRSQSAAKAQSILKSLNTSFYGAPPAPESPEISKEAELADFDRKIYSAQKAMDTAMTAELKSLGVPFFGTKEHLVVSDNPGVSNHKGPEDQPKHSQIVTESQLLDLRRKMVKHLEDLYRD
ncbi:Hypothetical predicted protein [Lecanosticta acicola]|uniref:Uncharacterized protein n=1 Tax=Lecanosticta acicola TaxID=111012 RepID=A0AAI9E7M1_9PEZI|nr:Hypothetical predicted protein [Lecanosticta acicola]